MMTYQATKEFNHTNRIVSDLNANVLTETFEETEKLQLGDLYYSKNSNKQIVKHGTCAPCNSEFVETIWLRVY